MMEMLGVLRELGPLPFGGIAGMERLFQPGGGDGLADGNVQIPMQPAFMRGLDMDGLPGCWHGVDSFNARWRSRPTAAGRSLNGRELPAARRMVPTGDGCSSSLHHRRRPRPTRRSE